MAFSEICRICLCVNVRMFVLKNADLQNLYKTLTNSFTDENEGPIIVCFTCHARLISCRRLQQQAIESNALLEQLLAGGSMSTPKPYETRNEIQFTQVYHIDIWPEELNIENDCKDEIFSLDLVKVEEENFEIENYKFEENGNHETEQYITQTNNLSESSEKKIKSDSTDSNIDVVFKANLDFEGATIKSNPKVIKDDQPINEKGKHLANVMKKKIMKQKSVNILTTETSGASTKYIFECDGCTKKFSRKDILAKHISYSHNTQKNSDTTAVRTQVEQTPVPQLVETFNCDICEFKTSQKRYILTHFKAHAAKQVYCCNKCDYKCTKKSNLTYHMIIHTGEKPFSCNICIYRCSRKMHLQRHMKIHTGEKPFSCNICGHRYNTKDNLQTHIKIHTGEKPFSCNICEYRCIRRIQLQNHMNIHTGEKTFSCNICEYRCIKKIELQRHMKIHTEEKPYSCNICGYRCAKKSILQRHTETHTGGKPYSCHKCEFRCKTKGGLQAHMKIHTGEKPHLCHICEYKCIQKTNLQTHIKTHFREKPFSCNICEYRCTTENKLRRHMKKHNREKSFSCNICEYKCIQKNNLIRHMKIHTRL